MSNTDLGGGGPQQAGPGEPTARPQGVHETVGAAAEAVKGEAAHFAEAAQEKVMGKAEEAKSAAAETLGQFASAVRKAGDELAQNDQSMAGRMVQQAANGLEHVSRSLADKEPGELIDGIRDLGRKNPVAVIGAGLLIGIALGRFARSSTPEPEPSMGGAPYGGPSPEMSDDAAGPSPAMPGAGGAPVGGLSGTSPTAGIPGASPSTPEA